MRVRYALLLSLIITFIFIGNFFFFSSFHSELENVVINRVIDGDTVKIDDGRTIRLLNINTPEKNTFGAGYAANYLSGYLNKTIELESVGTEKYGRTLGRLYYGDEYLNWEIVRSGLGHTFLTQEDETRSFYDAQKKAMDEGDGIWEHSQYYRCVKMKINIKDEFVDLDVVCNVSLEDWTLSDESTKKYTFGKSSENRIRIYSASGKDTANERFWGEGNVWNNDRDSAIVRDKKGLLVDFYSYGY